METGKRKYEFKDFEVNLVGRGFYASLSNCSHLYLRSDGKLDIGFPEYHVSSSDAEKAIRKFIANQYSFGKSDIKSGMAVHIDDGYYTFLAVDTQDFGIVLIEDDGDYAYKLSDFDADLKSKDKDGEPIKIVAVFKPSSLRELEKDNWEEQDIIWEHKSASQLHKEELGAQITAIENEAVIKIRAIKQEISGL